jgi:hypothetical protein
LLSVRGNRPAGGQRNQPQDGHALQRNCHSQLTAGEPVFAWFTSADVQLEPLTDRLRSDILPNALCRGWDEIRSKAAGLEAKHQREADMVDGAMVAVVALLVMFAMWAVVLFGSSFFGPK